MESRQWAVGTGKATQKIIYDHLGLKITSRRIENEERVPNIQYPINLRQGYGGHARNIQ